MADTLGVSSVAVGDQHDLFEVAAPAPTCVADEGPVFACLGGSRLNTVGVGLNPAEMHRDRNVYRRGLVKFDRPAVEIDAYHQTNLH